MERKKKKKRKLMTERDYKGCKDEYETIMKDGT